MKPSTLVGPSSLCWFWWALFCVLESFQILIVVVYTYHFIPVVLKNPLTGQVQPAPLGFELGRDLLFYKVFLICACCLMLMGLLGLRAHVENERFIFKLKQFLIIDTFWFLLELFAAFKLVVYKYPFYNFVALDNASWVEPFFWTIFVLSILCKIFWPEIQHWLDNGLDKFLSFQFSGIVKFVVRLVFGGFIVACLYIPRLNPSLVPWLLFVFAYFVLCFVFLQIFLDSFWLAVFGTLLMIKMSLFHLGLAPYFWLYPQEMVIPFKAEVVFLLVLMFFARRRWWRAFGITVGVGAACLFFDFLHLFRGLPLLPVYYCLRVRQFFPFFFGLTVPVLYVFAFLWSLAKIFSNKKSWPYLILSVIAMYGLVTYSLYIFSSGMSFYGRVIFPLVVLICYGLKLIMDKIVYPYKRLAGIILVFMMALMLLTNRLFVIYPNILFFHLYQKVN